MTIVKDVPNRSRKILVVSTFGGSTHVAPMLEVAKILHQRGYIIEFACLEEGKKLLRTFPFISQVHRVACSMPLEHEEAMFRRMDEKKDGFKNAMYHLDSLWAETYKNLDSIMAVNRPDFIFTDDMDASGLDMAKKWQIPVPTNLSQMPKSVAPAKYIPGIPGLQQKHVTSEHVNLWDRISEELFALKFMFSLKDLIIANKKLRKANGAPPKKPSKHADHLMLVNNCFDVEAPKDLPPLVVPCGPILADEYAPLVKEIEPFLNSHQKVVYLAFGSRVNLPHWRIKRIINGLYNAMILGYIDGVIWALRVDKLSLENSADSK